MTDEKNAPPPSPQMLVTYSQAECDELCEIAERDGYEKAVQEIDQLTGGDGEYRYCLGTEDSDRHTPDAAAMIRRIVDRFETLNLLDDTTKTGRDQEWGMSPADQMGVSREAIDTWLEANCGKGLPFKEAIDQASMLHGLAYILRQIEGTDKYMVKIGQVGPATSALRMALDHFARAALSTATEGSGE